MQFEVGFNMLLYVEGKKNETQAIYEFLVNRPDYFFAHEKYDRDEIAKYLLRFKKRPSMAQKLESIQPAKMNWLLSRVWINNVTSWENISVESRSVYVRRFWSIEDQMTRLDDALFKGIDASWLVQLSVKEIQALTVCPLRTCHKVISLNEAVKDQLTPDQLRAFNAFYSL